MRNPLSLFLLPALLLPACHGNTLDFTPDDGYWVPLWDGATLDGWSMAGPGAFLIEDGALRATGGMGLLWYSAESFRDFVLKLEWMVEEAEDNSGVFVRFPDPGDDPWVAVNQGYEIQICDAAEDKHNTGSIYSFQGPTSIPTRPPGEWNEYTITVVGQHYTVQINGETVNEFDGERSREGYIGLQNHDDGSPVRFRNIRVRRLAE
ncbi:MAG: DUF1080 domain-containing protein [Planctomycetota bacterium]|nr:MAG: DUF1080 domain-containing protein [Planctomycetota bacterium]